MPHASLSFFCVGTARISDETLERWEAASAEGGMLRLPDPNPFIPTDFGRDIAET